MKKYSQFLKELPSKTVVFAFGRFNPPTTGHELLVKAVKKLATANKADHAIYASKSKDAKKNPLTVEKKVHYLSLMFPNTNFVAASSDVPTFIQAAKHLNKKYTNIIMVAGSDRIPEYQRILNQYNGKEFNFDTIQVISAGERDPDADDASGMSASKMRAVASKGDYAQFKKGLPSTMREIDGRRLMNDVRQGMGLDSIKEQLNLVKDNLREQYFRGEIFNIGDIVESAGVQYEIVKRGSNHLLLKEGSGNLVSKWIQDVVIVEQKEQVIEELMLSEELTDKTLKSQDKIKVARIIATMLGIENAESSSNPDQLVNLALRKVRTKTFTPDSIRILQQMLNLATEVGIKYDPSLKPQRLKEAVKQVTGDDSIPVGTDSPVVNTKSTYNMAKDRLRYKDFQKLNNGSKGITEASVDQFKQAGEKEEDDTNAIDQHDVNDQAGASVAEPQRTVGHLMTHPYSKDDNLRRRKVKYHLGEQSEQLDEISSKLAGNYYGKVVQQHLKKVGGVRHNMYDRMEKDLGAKRKQGVDRALDRVIGNRKTNEGVELAEGQTDDWKKIQSMDKGSVLQGKEGAKKRLAYLQAVHAHHKKYGNDTKKVKDEIERINRSRLAEEETLDEANFASTMKKAIDAHERGDHTRAKYHLANAKTARYAMKSTEISKHKELLDKYSELSKLHEAVVCPVCNHPEEKCQCDSNDIVTDDDEQLGAKNAKGFDAFFEDNSNAVDMSAYDLHNDEDEMSDEELEAMANSIEDMEDILDAYDDEELAVIDDETGEEVEDEEEEKAVNEEALNEVLSRIERMRAKVRLKRTQALRTRKMKIALRVSSGTSKINKRSRRLAVKLMKKRLLRGRDASKISVGEKERIERIIQKRKPLISRLALKLAPRVRSIEKARLSHKAFTKTPTPSVGM